MASATGAGAKLTGVRMHLSFGQFELDTEAYELRANGEPCHLEPKVFDLLSHFVRHPGQVFSHDDLIEAVWRGRLVSETTVSTCIKNARKALGDSGSAQNFIRTVRGRGFRFDGEVRGLDVDGRKPSKQTTSTAVDRSAHGPIREDTIAAPALLIWPLRVLMDDAEAVQLSAALAHDLARILTRLPLLRLSVQPRADGQGISPGARAMHEGLGVDYVLDGTLQRLGDQFRINAQLVDARTGFQLWGEQFSIAGPLTQALDLTPIAIIAKLEPQLQRAIYAKLRSGDGLPNSRQLFLEAASVLVLKGWRQDAFCESAELLRRSCKLDDQFALAHAFLSLVVGLGERIGLLVDREQAKAEAQQAAERALDLDSFDSTVLGYAGCALADIGQRERALPILSNAVELSPANAQAWAALGSARLLSNQLDEGIRDLAHGIAISPLDSRLAVWGTLLCSGLLRAGRIEEALDQGRLACRRDDRCFLPRVALAGAQYLHDEAEAASRSLREAYRIKPDLSSEQIAAIVGWDLCRALERLPAAS